MPMLNTNSRVVQFEIFLPDQVFYSLFSFNYNEIVLEPSPFRSDI